MDADTPALESQIDELVYDLYGLTKEEREIVEGKSKARVESGGGAGGPRGARDIPANGGTCDGKALERERGAAKEVL